MDPNSSAYLRWQPLEVQNKKKKKITIFIRQDESISLFTASSPIFLIHLAGIVKF